MESSRKKSARLRFGLASFAALSLFASRSALAQDTLSSSAGATASWNLPATWADGTVPTSTDDVRLDYTNQNPGVTTLLGLDGAQVANSLTFGSVNGPALGAFSLQANSTAVTTARTLTLTTGNVTFASNLTGAVTIGGTNGTLSLASGATGNAGSGTTTTPATVSATLLNFTQNSSQSVNLNSVIGNLATNVLVSYSGTGTGVINVGANTFNYPQVFELIRLLTSDL